MGLEIIVVSPDLPQSLLDVIEKNSLNFPLYSDSKLEMAEAFGLGFHLDDNTASIYLTQYKIDLEKYSGESHHNLPVPAVYLVDKNKEIVFNFCTPDHTIRMEPQNLLEVTKTLFG